MYCEVKSNYVTMKYILNHNRVLPLLLTGLLLIAVPACDNTVGSDAHEHDSDPFGMVLIMNGEEIVKQEGHDVIYLNDSPIEVKENEETEIIHLQWLNEYGEAFLPATEDGYTLSWAIEDEELLDVVQHDTDGPWNFHLLGKSAGMTTLSFLLWHNDHEHFTSVPFEVQIK